jgi:hypothetical protein
MMIKHIRNLSVMLLMVLLVGCGSGYETDISYTDDHGSGNTDLSVDLTLYDRFEQPSDVFSQGESIELVLTITNYSNDVIGFDFDSAQRYDFYVDSVFGEEWAWSDDKLFEARSGIVDIPPHSSVSYSEFVDSGRFYPGNYTAEGVFVGQGLSARTSFRVM